MSTKVITAWVNGAVQSLEVADTAYVTPPQTIEDRITALELSVVTKIISLPATNWTGDASPYSQVVTVDGVTGNSKIDLQPSVEQLTTLQDEEISLLAVNNSGIVTVYALNNKPSVDFEMQALVTEVN